MSVDSAEFAHEMEQIEQARVQDIVATRAELAATLRVAGEHLEHADRLTAALSARQLYDTDYADSAAGPDAERFIDDAARSIRAAHRIITSLP